MENRKWMVDSKYFQETIIQIGESKIECGCIIRLASTIIPDFIPIRYLMVDQEMIDRGKHQFSGEFNMDEGNVYDIDWVMLKTPESNYSDDSYREKRNSHQKYFVLTKANMKAVKHDKAEVELESELSTEYQKLVENSEIASLEILADCIGKGKISVDVLNVGMGDSSLVSFPDKRIWVIDAYNSNKILNYISHRDLSPHKVNIIILSHLHYDHIEGMFTLIDLLKPEFVLFFPTPITPTKYAIEVLGKASSCSNLLKLEQPISCANGSYTVNMIPSSVINSKNYNDHEILVTIAGEEKQILMAGDTSASQICEVVQNSTYWSSSKSSIYKVSHHGSLTGYNSCVLKKINPKQAVTSSSRSNRYRLPKQQVVDAINYHTMSLKGRHSLTYNGDVSYEL